MKPLIFKTAISGHTKKGMELRSVALSELVEEANFVKTLFLSLTGREAKPAETHLLNAILVASIDHGIQPASGFVPRAVAASGGDVLSAMASTLLALGPYHGGAITATMQVLQDLATRADDKEKTAQEIIKEHRQAKKRLPGFGHPQYKKEDPRVTQLFAMARAARLSVEYCELARLLETTLESTTGKPLVLNVDGGIAALLLALNIPPAAGNAIFGVARVAGSIAHILEEQSDGDWVRRLSPEAVEYAPDTSQRGQRNQ
jgi:citrate synthase